MQMLSTNATANAIQFPQAWNVSAELYLDLIARLMDECPEWAKHYKMELDSMKPLINARRKSPAVRPSKADPELLEALKEATEELERLANNQNGISEEDLTDIARPDANVIDRAREAISNARDWKNANEPDAPSYIVTMQSGEFNTEEFKYDTLKEAREGKKRLIESAKRHRKKDGIRRMITGPTEVEPDQEPGEPDYNAPTQSERDEQHGNQYRNHER